MTSPARQAWFTGSCFLATESLHRESKLALCPGLFKLDVKEKGRMGIVYYLPKAGPGLGLWGCMGVEDLYHGSTLDKARGIPPPWPHDQGLGAAFGARLGVKWTYRSSGGLEGNGWHGEHPVRCGLCCDDGELGASGPSALLLSSLGKKSPSPQPSASIRNYTVQILSSSMVCTPCGS